MSGQLLYHKAHRRLWSYENAIVWGPIVNIYFPGTRILSWNVLNPGGMKCVIVRQLVVMENVTCKKNVYTIINGTLIESCLVCSAKTA